MSTLCNRRWPITEASLLSRTMKNVTIRLPEPLLRVLSDQAAARGLPTTTYLRTQLAAASQTPAPIIEI